MKGSNVTIQNLDKSFGRSRILNNINAEIKKGEFFSLLGPSGCGKTTLLRCIAGFENCDNGAILLDSTDITPLQPNKRPVNTIFQSYALFPHLSVFENVAFPLRLKKCSSAFIKQEVEKYLSLVKLDEHTAKFPAQLSGGMKQRVAIARALVNQPSVLLLDEPLSALDAKLRQHMLIELDALHDDVGITFIYVTHDQAEAMSVSDHLAVMNKGEIVQYGTPSEIYESPADRFVADFIGETNFMEGRVIDTSGNYAIADITGMGKIEFDRDKPVETGDIIHLSLRPEKIRITKGDAPATPGMNSVKGTVDEVIYTGFQSKFFVKVSSDCMFKVMKQHIKFQLDEVPIGWKDQVSISWDPNDAFLIEVRKG